MRPHLEVGDIVEVLHLEAFKDSMHLPMYARVVEGGQGSSSALVILCGGFGRQRRGFKFYLPTYAARWRYVTCRIIPNDQVPDKMWACIAAEVLVGEEQ